MTPRGSVKSCAEIYLQTLTKPSQILPHHAADGFVGFDMHEVGGVGVDAQSESRIGMAQHAGDCADVHPTLQCRSREGVPKSWNSIL